MIYHNNGDPNTKRKKTTANISRTIITTRMKIGRYTRLRQRFSLNCIDRTKKMSGEWNNDYGELQAFDR